MKNILLLVHEDDGQEARLQAALDLTRALDGHLTCLDAVQMPYLVDDYYSGANEAMLLAERRKVEQANGEALKARLAHEDVSWDWHDATGDLPICVLDVAPLADAIVLSSEPSVSTEVNMRSVLETVLCRGGKPVIAMPQHLRSFDVAGTAIVAWDGSAPCIAAMRASVPLLKLAQSVNIIALTRPSSEVLVSEAAEYLSRHGIAPSVRSIDDASARADAVILSECEKAKASYCVMGAFGTSRLRQHLLGGVTCRLLDAAKLPLVLAH